MKVNWRRAQKEQKLDEINRQESDTLSFCFALGYEFCRNLRNFGKGRLNDLRAGTYVILADNFMQYRDDEDKDFSPEEVPFLYTGLRNQITALVDVDEIEKQYAFDPKYGGWKSGIEKEKRDSRYLLLCDRERMFRSFWYAMMLYLYRTYNWGPDRLTRFYKFVRQTYRTIYQEYLVCSAAKDAWIVKTMTGMVKKYTDLGVEF